MSTVSICGRISPKAYLHIKYDPQVVDGTQHTPHDMVIVPADTKGTVSFTLPQGVRARIELWSQKNGDLENITVVLAPRQDSVWLDQLLIGAQ